MRRYLNFTTPTLFEKDGKTLIRTPGVDMGGGGQPVVLYRKGAWAVVRQPGGMAWSGNGMPWTWHPTSYAVANLETWEQDGEEVEPGRKWKKVVDTMKICVNTLAGETA